jgi:hypothetical protein
MEEKGNVNKSPLNFILQVYLENKEEITEILNNQEYRKCELMFLLKTSREKEIAQKEFR